jgi:hypothetical protein
VVQRKIRSSGGNNGRAAKKKIRKIVFAAKNKHLHCNLEYITKSIEHD